MNRAVLELVGIDADSYDEYMTTEIIEGGYPNSRNDIAVHLLSIANSRGLTIKVSVSGWKNNYVVETMDRLFIDESFSEAVVKAFTWLSKSKES